MLVTYWVLMCAFRREKFKRYPNLTDKICYKTKKNIRESFRLLKSWFYYFTTCGRKYTAIYFCLRIYSSSFLFTRTTLVLTNRQERVPHLEQHYRRKYTTKVNSFPENIFCRAKYQSCTSVQSRFAQVMYPWTLRVQDALLSQVDEKGWM